MNTTKTSEEKFSSQIIAQMIMLISKFSKNVFQDFNGTYQT